jgi:AraC-like DNA-binding protein
MSSPLIRDDLFRRLCRARDQLHRDFAEPITVAELARVAGMSPFHFLRMFRQAFAMTPRQYLTRVRIERAKSLLAADLPVTGVCLEVGFSSLGSFSALFAERVGCPPTAWRKKLWQVATTIEPATARVVPWCFASHYGGHVLAAS